eukprot:CAMPEP_0119130812 /NCGR_PEP_ID=MMETSP1310-20130426/8823_1 /TAXON_ID=464262 /ORGANISM="Genus nov. species nov., Strain RCC2339" /LENGTH=245 /DNA_ID=CAMNT_0007121347 /DNA_START=99 /DNA_END=836 /DNA_ORIENTATION=+
MAASYGTSVDGEPDTLEYRVHFTQDGKKISPFHDVPLYADQAKGIYNMIVEIPRGTRAKLEIDTKGCLNPIKQDTKKGKLRYVQYGDGYMWNYGAIPQTWEDPNHTDESTGAKGDNDPLDACEIGSAVGKTGEIKQVKVLGTYAMIDEGECDWKHIVIDVNDPLAADINDIDDVEKVMPGKLAQTFEWLRDYKVPDGKPQNTFGLENKPQNAKFAKQIVAETHAAWQKLVDGKTDSDLAITRGPQ